MRSSSPIHLLTLVVLLSTLTSTFSFYYPSTSLNINHSPPTGNPTSLLLPTQRTTITSTRAQSKLRIHTPTPPASSILPFPLPSFIPSFIPSKSTTIAATIPLLILLSPLPSHALQISPDFITSIRSTGFFQAFSLIFLSEIGDKTFFIAGLLAMKTSRFVSFIGSLSALTVMTGISVLIGQLFHAVPAGLTNGLPLDDYCAIGAFTFFGLKTLKEAFDLEATEESKMEEEAKEAEEEVEGIESKEGETAWGLIASAFGLVFAAEFGDRSFLATIALGAAQNPLSVFGGAVAGHAIATSIAVLGGSVIAKYISEKVIGYIGGALFLVFAVTTALGVF